MQRILSFSPHVVTKSTFKSQASQRLLKIILTILASPISPAFMHKRSCRPKKLQHDFDYLVQELRFQMQKKSLPLN